MSASFNSLKIAEKIPGAWLVQLKNAVMHTGSISGRNRKDIKTTLSTTLIPSS